jgi:hypothetical protein
MGEQNTFAECLFGRASDSRLYERSCRRSKLRVIEAQHAELFAGSAVIQKRTRRARPQRAGGARRPLKKAKTRCASQKPLTGFWQTLGAAYAAQADCKWLLTGGQMGNVIPVHDEDGPTKLDVIDALDAEIDTMWGLIAALQTIFTEHDGDPHIKGALRLANSHLDALATIRRELDRL